MSPRKSGCPIPTTPRYGAGDVWKWTALDADSKLIVGFLIGDRDAERRYSPPERIGTRKLPVEGRPDPAHVSKSFVERQNLTMRMHMRRFTRLTNAFSKKVESHAAMVAIYAVWCNFVRVHKSLRVTPAMAAGITDRLWSMEHVVAPLDAREAPPAKRGPPAQGRLGRSAP